MKPIEAKEFPILDEESVLDLYVLIRELTDSFPLDKSERKNFFFYLLDSDE